MRRVEMVLKKATIYRNRIRRRMGRKDDYTRNSRWKATSRGVASPAKVSGDAGDVRDDAGEIADPFPSGSA